MYQFFPDRKEEQKIPQYYLKTDSVALICDETMIMFNSDYELFSSDNIVEVALPLSTDSTAILNTPYVSIVVASTETITGGDGETIYDISEFRSKRNDYCTSTITER